MHKPKFLQNLTMRHRLFLSFVVLIAFLLLALWLTQVVFLEDIYKSVKRRDLARTAERLADTLVDTDDYTTLTRALSDDNDYCLLVLDFASGAYTPTVLATPRGGLPHRDCVLHDSARYGDLYPLYCAAASDARPHTERYIYDSERGVFFSLSGELFDAPDGTPVFPEHLLLARAVETERGTRALFLSTTLSPVSATTDAILASLWILTGVLLAVGFVLSYFLAKRLSAPIAAMTADAKRLAEGDTKTTFTAEGYREAAELADALTHASAELSRAAVLRRELLANVSHDLRTPVTLIAGYSEMIRDIPGENTPENAEILLGEANRLSALIDDLMDLSKLEAGVQTLENTTFSLSALLADEMARYNKLHPDITICFTADADITITSDKSRVLQILYNLVNNAVNHVGADNTVLVSLSALPPETDGRAWARISVTDHGAGIPKEELSRIWDRYYKVDENRRRSAVGTGLGLSIVRSTTQLLGGRGGVTSTPNLATTFWFELPLSFEKES